MMRESRPVLVVRRVMLAAGVCFGLYMLLVQQTLELFPFVWLWVGLNFILFGRLEAAKAYRYRRYSLLPDAPLWVYEALAIGSGFLFLMVGFAIGVYYWL